MADYATFTTGMNFQDAYEKYYAILRSSYVAQQGELYLKSPVLQEAEAEQQKLVNVFLEMVDKLAHFERQKEQAYIAKWVESFRNKGLTKLANELQVVLNSPDGINFSQAFEIIELYRQGFIEDIDNFQDTFTNWQKEYSQFSNKFIKKTMEAKLDSLGARLVDMTPKELLEELTSSVSDAWDTTYSGSQDSARFSTFLNSFNNDLVKIVKDMGDIRGNGSPEEVDRNFNGPLGLVFKIKEPKALNISLKAKLIDGLVNGLSQESFLALFGMGASTARTQRELRYFTKKLTQLVPTETDVYAALSFELNPNEAIINKIKNLERDVDIQALLESTEAENNFIIHYSSKDLTISEGSKSSVRAKIKGQSSLDSKIDALEQMGRAANKEKFIHELIFEAINTGKDLLYSDQKEILQQVSDSLTALSFSFMFDDFERQFEQIVKNENSKTVELNLYMISGNFFAISDILFILYDFVKHELVDSNGKPVKSIISVGFKPAPNNYYNSPEVSNLVGEARWEFVRDMTIRNTMMEVRMATNTLKQLIYNIK